MEDHIAYLVSCKRALKYNMNGLNVHEMVCPALYHTTITEISMGIGNIYYHCYIIMQYIFYKKRRAFWPNSSICASLFWFNNYDP